MLKKIKFYLLRNKKQLIKKIRKLKEHKLKENC